MLPRGLPLMFPIVHEYWSGWIDTRPEILVRPEGWSLFLQRVGGEELQLDDLAQARLEGARVTSLPGL